MTDFSAMTKADMKKLAKKLGVEVESKKPNKPTHDELVTALELYEREHEKEIKDLSEENEEDETEEDETDEEDDSEGSDPDEGLDDEPEEEEPKEVSKKITKKQLQAQLLPPEDFGYDHNQAMAYARSQIEKWLSLGFDLRGMDFSNLDLSGLDARKADFSKCNFSGCVVEGANFQGSIFEGANIESTDFSVADIRWSVGIQRMNHMGMPV